MLDLAIVEPDGKQSVSGPGKDDSFAAPRLPAAPRGTDRFFRDDSIAGVVIRWLVERRGRGHGRDPLGRGSDEHEQVSPVDYA